MRSLLKTPKSIFMIACQTNHLSQRNLDDDMKYRSLIVCTLTHANKWSGAVTSISNDIARAVAKYKPMRTFLGIPTGFTSTNFAQVLAAVDQGHRYVSLGVNPIEKTNIEEFSAETREKVWAGRVKFYLHSFNSSDRLLTQLSPTSIYLK